MLAVDVGNTFTRAALFKDGNIAERWRFRTRDVRLDGLGAFFSDLASRNPVDRVWFASVAPHANAALDSAAARAGFTRRFIRSDLDSIMPHRLRTPETTGVDRLLASLAAGDRFFPEAGGGHGYVTIQCGSAVTVDHVDGAGFFRGGHILPGPAMWLGSLATAEQLPDLSAEQVDWDAGGVGDNTRDAIMRGMAVALPAAVVAAATAPSRAAGVVTGGWGEAVVRRFPASFVFDRDLVLHGIRLFAEREEGP